MKDFFSGLGDMKLQTCRGLQDKFLIIGHSLDQTRCYHAGVTKYFMFVLPSALCTKFPVGGHFFYLILENLDKQDDWNSILILKF